MFPCMKYIQKRIYSNNVYTPHQNIPYGPFLEGESAVLMVHFVHPASKFSEKLQSNTKQMCIVKMAWCITCNPITEIHNIDFQGAVSLFGAERC